MVAIPFNPKHNAESRALKATLLVASTLTVMAGATIAPALPILQEEFAEINHAELLVRLVLTLPALFIAIGAPIAGYIVDRFGRKRLLMLAVLIYGFAGGAGFITDSIGVLLFERAILGLAVGAIMTCTTTLIADYFEGTRRSTFLGIQAAFAGLGGMVYLTLGGQLADIGWHEPFLIYLLAFIFLPFVVLFVYEPPKIEPVITPSPDKHIDVIAILPVRLLIFTYCAMTLTQIIFYAIPVQLPFYLKSLVNASASQTGLAIAGLSLFYSIGSASFGRLYKLYGNFYILLLGFSLTACGYFLMTLANGWILIGVGMVISGYGLGLCLPNLITWVANGVPPVVRGRAMGGLTTSLFLGQFLSPFLTTPLAAKTSAGGVYAALGVLVMVLVAGALLFRKQILSLT